jgi:Tol biopolymer transport system component
MTGRDRFDVLFADALEDLAAPHYPDYFDDALDVAVRRSQRPAWAFPERWLPVSTLARGSTLVPALPWRTMALVIAVLALLVAAFAMTVGRGPDQRPAPPFGLAANGAIAYAVGGDLYVRDSPTGEARLLLGAPPTDVGPVFSRQGTQLGFIRIRGQGAATTETLMVANADGSEPRALASAAIIESADWSPDGTRVAIVAADDREDPGALLVASISGSETAREIDLPVPSVYQVYWRPPAGDELILLAGSDIERAIYAVRPDGSGFRRISAPGTDTSYMGPFALSPDGGRLAFTEGGDQVRIRILDLESGEAPYWGGSLPEFTDSRSPEHWGFPVFSPDGTRIAFGRYWDEAFNGAIATINHQVFVGSVAGNGADAVPVSELHRSRSGHAPFGYSFSPDGTQVIIQLNDVEETWLADSAGGAPQRLAWGAVMDPPNWQRLAP